MADSKAPKLDIAGQQPHDVGGVLAASLAGCSTIYVLMASCLEDLKRIIDDVFYSK